MQPQAARLDVRKAVERMDMLRQRIGQRVDRINRQSEAVAEQWQGLGRLGGQRDDHAANLLGTLQEPIADLQSFLATIQEQLEIAIAGPFGEQDGGRQECDGPPEPLLYCHAKAMTQPTAAEDGAS